MALFQLIRYLVPMLVRDAVAHPRLYARFAWQLTTSRLRRRWYMARFRECLHLAMTLPIEEIDQRTAELLAEWEMSDDRPKRASRP